MKLAEARERLRKGRELLANGIDPAEQRKAEKAATMERIANTFGAMVAEWWAKREKEIVAGTAKRERRLMEAHLLPYVGDLPIGDITAPALLTALRNPAGTCGLLGDSRFFRNGLGGSTWAFSRVDAALSIGGVIDAKRR